PPSVRMDDEGATTSAARPIASPTLGVTAKPLRFAVCAPARVTRLPGSESGACVAGSHSPWPPPLAPPAPRATELRKVAMPVRGCSEIVLVAITAYPTASVRSFQAYLPPTSADKLPALQQTSMPRQRLRCVLGMLSSLEVKVLRST